MRAGSGLTGAAVGWRRGRRVLSARGGNGNGRAGGSETVLARYVMRLFLGIFSGIAAAAPRELHARAGWGLTW